MKYEKMSLRDGYHFLHKKRPMVRPNRGFFNQLINYEGRLFGRKSVTMLPVTSVFEKSCDVLIVPDLYLTDYKRMLLLESLVARAKRLRRGKTNLTPSTSNGLGNLQERVQNMSLRNEAHYSMHSF